MDLVVDLTRSSRQSPSVTALVQLDGVLASTQSAMKLASQAAAKNLSDVIQSSAGQNATDSAGTGTSSTVQTTSQLMWGNTTTATKRWIYQLKMQRAC